MLELRRTVRFSINPGPLPEVPDSGRNGFAGSPPSRGLARHYELDVTCRGDAHPVIGYLVDIKDVDRAVRDGAIPIIQAACNNSPNHHPASMLPSIIEAIEPRLAASVASIAWRLSPYTCVEMESASRDIALLRHQFDFSASHRLHVPSMSDAENREIFGKCNNPSGHGHNYRIEICLEVSASSLRPGPAIADVERITEDTIIARFDHKYLNVDTTEFGPDGVIPSVENIARVCFDLLDAATRAAFSNARLRSVTVWETDRTCATYPAR